ncbi:MAG: hypothetical protein ACRDPA_06695 [Solirubrobacteraceae bacterium]
MTENDEQDGASLDALLAKMPQIAEVVGKFPEAVQQQAFDALMAEATGGGTTATKRTADRSAENKSVRKRTTTRKKANGEGVVAPRRSGGPKQLRDLDLTPSGKLSFVDFVNEKQPTTNHDRNVLSVYYCDRILEVGAVTDDHVYTCYRDMGWRLPSPNLNNGLSLTSSRKRFLDTSDNKNITLTSKGLNYVEHDLPAKPKEQ